MVSVCDELRVTISIQGKIGGERVGLVERLHLSLKQIHNRMDDADFWCLRCWLESRRLQILKNIGLIMLDSPKLLLSLSTWSFLSLDG